MEIKDADILANNLLINLRLIKIDIENAENILIELNKKYKDTQIEYSKIYNFTTEAKDIELKKKEQILSALELDKVLFLERQKKKLGKN